MTNDVFNVQRGIISRFSGDDTYVISPELVEANAEIIITDASGANTIQLIGGVEVAASQKAGDAVQLTLSNGAVITVLGAGNYSFALGGDPLTGVAPASVASFTDFAALLDSTPAFTVNKNTFSADELNTAVDAEAQETVDAVNDAIGSDFTIDTPSAGIIEAVQLSDNAQVLLDAITAVDAAATTVQQVADNATTAALTDADGEVYDDVDAAIVSNDAEVLLAAITAVDATAETVQDVADNATTAALTDADGEVYDDVDAAIVSNDDAATDANVAAQTDFTTLAELVTAYDALANPEGGTFGLTTNADTFIGQGEGDVFTAASGTLGEDDIIIDAVSGDNDQMTILATGATLASTGIISNIENVDLSVDLVAADFTVTDASGLIGSDLTVNSVRAGGVDTAIVNDIGSNSSVTAGTRIADLTVDTTGARSGLTVNGGTGATTVNDAESKLTNAVVDASAGTNVNVEFGAESSGITVTAGSGTVDINDGGPVETANLTLNAASATTVTADFADDSSNIDLTTGSGNVEINDGAGAVNTGLVIDASAADGGTIDVSLLDGSDVTITAGSDAGAITVGSTSVAATTDNGSSIAITADAADIATGITGFDDVTLVLNGSSGTVTLDGEVYDVAVSATEAEQTVTALAAAVNGTVALTGSQVITFEMDGEDVDDVTVTSDGASDHVFKISTTDQAADIDLSGVSTDVEIELAVAMAAAGTGEITLADGASVKASTAQTAALGFTAAAAESSSTLDVAGVNHTGSFAYTNTGTLTLTASADNANAVTVTVDSDGSGTQGNIVLSGSNNIALAGATDAELVDGTNFSGNVTATMSATLDNLITGSGDDAITAYNGDFTVDAGTGDNTFVAAAVDLSDDTVSLSGFSVVSMGTTDMTVLNGQLAGTETVTGTTGDLTIAGTATANTIDVSGFTVGLTQAAGAAGGFVNVNGLAGNDVITGGDSSDILQGGTGDDAITGGGGVDYITGGAGADTIMLTEDTAVADYIVITSVTDGSADGVVGGSFSGYDTITGFVSGTDKVLGDTANANDTVTIGTNLFDAGALTVIASDGATLAGNDLASAADALDVDALVAFLADAGVAGSLGGGANYVGGEKELLAITFSDENETHIFALESADTSFTADEVNLLAVVDDVLVAGDLIIA